MSQLPLYVSNSGASRQRVIIRRVIIRGVEPGHAAAQTAARAPRGSVFLENATVRGRAWYKYLVAPLLTMDVTRLIPGCVCSESSFGESSFGGWNPVTPRPKPQPAHKSTLPQICQLVLYYYQCEGYVHGFVWELTFINSSISTFCEISMYTSNCGVSRQRVVIRRVVIRGVEPGFHRGSNAAREVAAQTAARASRKGPPGQDGDCPPEKGVSRIAHPPRIPLVP